MISWGTIVYGAVLSAVAAGAVVAGVVRPRRIAVIGTAAAGAFLGPVAWNAVLRATHGNEFFTDAPVVVMPASWQDAGSGVVTVAAAALALGAGPLAAGSGRRVAATAVLAGLAAFLVDVYLY